MTPELGRTRQCRGATVPALPPTAAILTHHDLGTYTHIFLCFYTFRSPVLWEQQWSVILTAGAAGGEDEPLWQDAEGHEPPP